MLRSILTKLYVALHLARPVAIASLLSILALAEAHAGICESLNTQLRSVSRSASPETVALSRQLTALRGLERQRNCSASKGTGLFGFFSACGDLKRRKASVMRSIQNASASGGRGSAVAIRARMDEMGCAVASAKPKSRERDYSWGSGNSMLFCVRQSDGYLFPAPNSQFVSAEDYKLTLSRCQYICEDPNMDVYVRDSGSMETEDMVSISQRRPYRDLPTAFKYRDAAEFNTCNSQRYHQRVAEQRARETTPANVDAKGVVLPLPISRPDVDPTTVMAYSSENQATKATPFDRKVRIVGAPYLPEQENVR